MLSPADTVFKGRLGRAIAKRVNAERWLAVVGLGLMQDHLGTADAERP